MQGASRFSGASPERVHGQVRTHRGAGAGSVGRSERACGGITDVVDLFMNVALLIIVYFDVDCVLKSVLPQAEIERLKTTIVEINKSHAISEKSWRDVKAKMFQDHTRSAHALRHEATEAKQQAKELKNSLDRAKADIIAMRAQLPVVSSIFDICHKMHCSVCLSQNSLVSVTKFICL